MFEIWSNNAHEAGLLGAYNLCSLDVAGVQRDPAAVRRASGWLRGGRAPFSFSGRGGLATASCKVAMPQDGCGAERL